MPPELDIVIPVYNEGGNIVATLAGLAGAVTTPARVLICYDDAGDDTLPAIQGNPQAHAGLPVTSCATSDAAPTARSWPALPPAPPHSF